MIRLNQKNFFLQFLPALGNIAMIGGTGVSIAQGKKQEKMQEEANEQQEEANQKMLEQQKHDSAKQQALLAQQNKKLEKISQKVNAGSLQELGPTMQQNQSILDQPVQQASYSSTQKEFAVGGTGLVQNVKQLGKDLYHTFWKADKSQAGQIVKDMNGKARTIVDPVTKKTRDMTIGDAVNSRRQFIVNGAGMGLGMGIAGYGINKAISSDAKKSGINFQNVQQLQQSQYSAVSAGKSVMAGLGNKISSKLSFIKTPKPVKDWMAKHPTATSGIKGVGAGLAFGGALTGIPAIINYNQQKGQLKDMSDYVAQTQQQPQQTQLQQRSYASWESLGTAVSSGLKSAKKWIGSRNMPLSVQGMHGQKHTIGQAWNSFKSHPAQSLASWYSKNLAFAGGTDGATNFASDLAQTSKGSWGKKAGTWLSNPKHAFAATAASIPVGAGVMALTWDGGEKAVNKVGKAVDPHAYDYDNFNNQQVQ